MEEVLRTELNYKINLGAGQNPKEGFLSVDRWASPITDVVHDLETYPWPWPDESVAEIYANHFFEHVQDQHSFFNEMYRVMKVGATAKLICPFGQSVRAWQDPDHKHAIYPQTFQYANKKWRDDNKLSHYNLTCNFDFRHEFALNPNWANRSADAINFALVHYFNVADDIHITMFKLPL